MDTTLFGATEYKMLLLCRAVEVSNKREVAIKIVENIEDNIEEVLQEYQILSDHSLHPNIPVLYGAFRYYPTIVYTLIYQYSTEHSGTIRP